MGIYVVYKRKEAKECQWTTPPPRTEKLNADGSLSQDGAGFGGTVRNHEGKVLLSYAGSNKMIKFVLYQELRAIEAVIKACLKLNCDSLAAVDSIWFLDPYLIFTCNGKTKPVLSKVFEFDAMDDPPSVMDVEVFDFEGPFSEAKSMGHAEINFVKSYI
ncbi:hypothetical protein IFM89_023054 [Coptis chinensis]|uniref:RNase H type-1 domain-containing protein n=1 Tax=Coptis chinensis TaxID=261450 RepID=A0A835IXB8_9MAGN|nr:hypothetical protein IFM89_023054 [Coptis chinensis]